MLFNPRLIFEPVNSHLPSSKTRSKYDPHLAMTSLSSYTYFLTSLTFCFSLLAHLIESDPQAMVSTEFWTCPDRTEAGLLISFSEDVTYVKPSSSSMSLEQVELVYKPEHFQSVNYVQNKVKSNLYSQIKLGERERGETFA